MMGGSQKAFEIAKLVMNRHDKIYPFLDKLEDDGSPQGKQFLDAIELVHRTFNLIVRNP